MAVKLNFGKPAFPWHQIMKDPPVDHVLVLAHAGGPTVYIKSARLDMLWKVDSGPTSNTKWTILAWHDPTVPVDVGRTMIAVQLISAALISPSVKEWWLAFKDAWDMISPPKWVNNPVAAMAGMMGGKALALDSFAKAALHAAEVVEHLGEAVEKASPPLKPIIYGKATFPKIKFAGMDLVVDPNMPDDTYAVADQKLASIGPVPEFAQYAIPASHKPPSLYFDAGWPCVNTSGKMVRVAHLRKVIDHFQNSPGNMYNDEYDMIWQKDQAFAMYQEWLTHGKHDPKVVVTSSPQNYDGAVSDQHFALLVIRELARQMGWPSGVHLGQSVIEKHPNWPLGDWKLVSPGGNVAGLQVHGQVQFSAAGAWEGYCAKLY